MVAHGAPEGLPAVQSQLGHRAASRLRPISFRCTQLVNRTPAELCAAIADVDRWPEFRGYGPLPGIASAHYELRAVDLVGSRIRVRNTDGSSHVEVVESWAPESFVRMTLQEFSPPLSRLASHFVEEWTFQSHGDATAVTRRLEMFPLSPAARPLLWLISLFLRRAIRRHLVQMAQRVARRVSV